jgi:hypothetical protein
MRLKIRPEQPICRRAFSGDKKAWRNDRSARGRKDPKLEILTKPQAGTFDSLEMKFVSSLMFVHSPRSRPKPCSSA